MDYFDDSYDPYDGYNYSYGKNNNNNQGQGQQQQSQSQHDGASVTSGGRRAGLGSSFRSNSSRSNNGRRGGGGSGDDMSTVYAETVYSEPSRRGEYTDPGYSNWSQGQPAGDDGLGGFDDNRSIASRSVPGRGLPRASSLKKGGPGSTRSIGDRSQRSVNFADKPGAAAGRGLQRGSSARSLGGRSHRRTDDEEAHLHGSASNLHDSNGSFGTNAIGGGGLTPGRGMDRNNSNRSFYSTNSAKGPPPPPKKKGGPGRGDGGRGRGGPGRGGGGRGRGLEKTKSSYRVSSGRLVKGAEDVSILRKVDLFLQGYDIKESKKSQNGERGLERSGSSRRSIGELLPDASEVEYPIIEQDGKKVIMVPVTPKALKKLPSERMPYLEAEKRFGAYLLPNRFNIEERPPKSLVLIWSLVGAELAFDLATTIIAFQALIGSDDCCGQRMELGPIPMSVTTPFFLLVIAELVFLVRAIVITLWPSLMTGDDDIWDLDDDENQEGDAFLDEDGNPKKKRSKFMKYLCCWLKWNAKMILRFVNFLVLLNPFFGCIIAWMLLYQSDKTEAFIVLALEGGSIVLHFASIYLEGGMTTWGEVAFHCIPIIPFLVSVSMILVYLKQGGVCYLVDQSVFLFSGCEVCDDGYPPHDNMCFVNGVNVTVAGADQLWRVDLDNGLEDLASDLTARTTQGTYCAEPEGSPGSFCFFAYH